MHIQDRTSSTIYKNYIEISKGGDERDNILLTLEEYGEWSSDDNLEFCCGYNDDTLFKWSKEVFNVQEAWHSPKKLPTMVHYRVLSDNNILSSERTPLLAIRERSRQRHRLTPLNHHRYWSSQLPLNISFNIYKSQKISFLHLHQRTSCLLNIYMSLFKILK